MNRYISNKSNKSIIYFLLFLFISLNGISQNYNELINNHLSNNLKKFDLNEADITEWRITSQSFSKQSKVRHIYIQQLYKGIPVFNAVSNISIRESDSKVFSLGNSFIGNLASKINSATPVLQPKTAITQVAKALQLGTPKVVELKKEKIQHDFVFSKSNISRDEIPVDLVYQPLKDGTVRLSWELNVNQKDGSHWWNVRVDAITGEILDKDDWTVNCNFDIKTGKHSHPINKNIFSLKKETSILEEGNYNVFALPVESPNHGSNSLVSNPVNSVASPFGWHDTNGEIGPEFTITRGNNVFARLDELGLDIVGYSPDGGDQLNFNFPLNIVNTDPDSYKDASLTNLFYMNNVMHDIWYQYGFDEDAGNFQVSNYGKFGQEFDEVIADGQDGAGRNNANFGTPRDGSNPRMQMFLWDNAILTISNSSVQGDYGITDSSFSNGLEDDDREQTGVSLDDKPVSGNLVLMNDGSANPTEGCNSTATSISGISGNIAVIRRGNCNFTDKIQLAQDNGAIGVLMVNNQPGTILMGGTTTTLNIPAVSIDLDPGELIIAALQNGETINAGLINYGIDGSFDNGIIAHEYGHGISNRLIGGPSNTSCMQNDEQLGEGWSDYFGMAITMKSTDTEAIPRGVATFSDNQSTSGTGIRRFPYSTDMGVNPFTFADVQAQELGDGSVSVHGVGSIWATMLWDLNWKMINIYGFDPDMYNGTGGNNKTMQLVIEGLKLTPCSSGFVEARDAILMADQVLNEGVNQCVIWEVFARRGLGFSASSGDASLIVDQTEAFDMPPADVLGGASCVLNVIDEELEQFKVYPNPTNSLINISLVNEVKNATTTIYDINGRQVYLNTSDLRDTVTINVENLSAGIYVLKINNSEINFSKKLIIN